MRGRDPHTGEPPRLTGTWAQIEDGKGGVTGIEKSVIGLCKELLCPTIMGAKHIQVVEASGRGRLPGGRLLRTWVG